MVRSSPMMEGTSLLGLVLLTYPAGRSPNGEVSLGRSDVRCRESPLISRSGFLVNMDGTSAQTQTPPKRRKESSASPQQKSIESQRCVAEFARQRARKPGNGL